MRSHDLLDDDDDDYDEDDDDDDDDGGSFGLLLPYFSRDDLA